MALAPLPALQINGKVAGFTGPHIGCETSICGACTVALDGRVVKSWSMFAVQADGPEVVTIEGLAFNGDLHPMQEAFWNQHGLQCGFCTPGMIMASRQLLERNPRPTEDEIRDGTPGMSASLLVVLETGSHGNHADLGAGR